MRLKRAGWMLVLAVTSVVVGALVGALVAVVRLAKIPLLAPLAALYVSGFRGTLLLVQLFVIYDDLFSISIQFDPITAGILGLSLNVGAYLSEILRGAINGMPYGQWDAAYSLGFTQIQVTRHVVGLQALRLAVPSSSNSLIKGTSLVSVIAVSELMLVTKKLSPPPFSRFRCT